MDTGMILEMSLRLVVACFLGSIIGFERVLRAKEAGLRTHFMVALGSALFMLVSQFGFVKGYLLLNQYVDINMVRSFDMSRVASQIVSGIGFIGAGTIILHKRYITGLTTAAGLWTTAAVGCAVGGGLYTVAIVATILTLIGFEILSLFMRRFSHSVRDMKITVRVSNEKVVNDLLEYLKNEYKVDITSYTAMKGDNYIRVTFVGSILERVYSVNKVLEYMKSIDDIFVEGVEQG